MIAGTAVAYEATVLITMYDGEVAVSTEHCTATAGGPARGSFAVEIEVPPTVDRLVVHTVAMEGDSPDRQRQRSASLCLPDAR